MNRDDTEREYVLTTELVGDRYGGKMHRPSCFYISHVVGGPYEERWPRGSLITTRGHELEFCKRCCRDDPFILTVDELDDGDPFSEARWNRAAERVGREHLWRFVIRRPAENRDDDEEAVA